MSNVWNQMNAWTKNDLAKRDANKFWNTILKKNTRQNSLLRQNFFQTHTRYFGRTTLREIWIKQLLQPLSFKDIPSIATYILCRFQLFVRFFTIATSRAFAADSEKHVFFRAPPERPERLRLVFIKKTSTKSDWNGNLRQTINGICHTYLPSDTSWQVKMKILSDCRQ